MREMYYDAKDVSQEEIQEEERQQRDAETYSTLKTTLQNRLYDVILNWNLFVPAYSSLLSLIIDNHFQFFLRHLVM